MVLRKFYITLVILTLVCLNNCSKENNFLPSAKIRSGHFVVTISEQGEIKAKRSVVVTTPSSLKGNAKVVKIVQEGTIVKKGDFLLQMDSDEIQQAIETIQNELKVLKAELDKSEANHKFSITQMELKLENAETRYKMAQMRLKQIEFESSARQEEEKLAFKLAENDYIETKAGMEVQKIINSTERSTLLFRYRQTELRLERKQQEGRDLIITAPEDGLVVYAKIWKGDKQAKLQIGDSPWRGQTLIELPDMSEMEVETVVDEVDIARLKTNMQAEVRLDAYRNNPFSGVITDISSLARKSNEGFERKVFDVTVKILKPDDKLKPGMTCFCNLIVADYKNVVYVPIESIFFKDSVSYVYLKKGLSYQKKVIKIIDKNETHATVGGLSQTDGEVLLSNPEEIGEAKNG